MCSQNNDTQSKRTFFLSLLHKQLLPETSLSEATEWDLGLQVSIRGISQYLFSPGLLALLRTHGSVNKTVRLHQLEETWPERLSYLHFSLPQKGTH